MMRLSNTLYQKAKTIKLLVLDVDGVLTDGGLYINDSGQECRRFNTLDGQGIKLLRQSGVETAVISGGQSKAVTSRMQILGVKYIYQNSTDKLSVFKTLLQKLKLNAQQTAYMGDDVLDLPVMKQAGLSIAVANAHALIKEHADTQTACTGGNGAVREVCDLIMKAQQTYEAQIAPYLKNPM